MNRLRFPRPLRRPAAAAALLAAALLAAPAAAAPPPSVKDLLYEGDHPAHLRARLLARADSAGDRPLVAGEAWYWAGASWARSGLADSALAAFARARALRGNPEETLAAVDVLIARGRPADLDSAAALMAPLAAQPAGGLTDEVALRDTWVRARLGDTNGLAALLDLGTSPLFRAHAAVANRPLWAGRFAPLALAAGDREAAWRLASPLAVATRGLDPGIVRIARDASIGRSIGTDWDGWIRTACVRADTTELPALLGLGARPLAVTAEDGAKLHAWFVPGPAGAAIAVVTSPADGAAAAACDSLVAHLRRAGLAVALLEPRGVRRSASPSAPAALLRAGDEEAAQRRLARDLGHALTAAGRAARVAAPRGVAVGVGADALAAALAAAGDRRFRALLLAGPEIAPVDRGWLRATIAASGVPAYIETGPENVLENLAVDRIVERLEPGSFRVADSGGRGSGAALFRAGPAEGARFAAWVSGALKRPRATPPARPR